jgi:hypothetical protein
MTEAFEERSEEHSEEEHARAWQLGKSPENAVKKA